MGHALEIECPHCGSTAEKRVSQTKLATTWDVFSYNPRLGTIDGRLRRRYCSICRNSFETIEIPLQTMWSIDGLMSEILQSTWRDIVRLFLADSVTEMRVALYIVSKVVPSSTIEDILGSIAEIQSVTNELMSNIDPKYGLYVISMLRSRTDVNPELEDKLSRILGHPSRSRRIREILDKDAKAGAT